MTELWVDYVVSRWRLRSLLVEDADTMEACNYSEMRDRFPGEWVLVGNPETDENLQVIAGNVLWHSKDRDEVYRKARELRPKHSAILYTGALPEEMVVVL